MAKRPKRYSTGQEKELSSQEVPGSGEKARAGQRFEQQGRPGSSGRASEADWERDESLGDEDLDRGEGREGTQRRR